MDLSEAGVAEVVTMTAPEDWVHEDFDEWSELTKERDGYREDQEREQRDRDIYG
jgi:hypothetical protein